MRICNGEAAPGGSGRAAPRKRQFSGDLKTIGVRQAKRVKERERAGGWRKLQVQRS